jgi:hypothetical protein
VVTPILNDVVTPVVNDVVSPVINDVVTPLVNDVVTPVVSDVVTPTVNDVIIPAANEVVTPVVNSVVTPVTSEATPITVAASGMEQQVAAAIAPVVEAAGQAVTGTVNQAEPTVAPLTSPVVSAINVTASETVGQTIGGVLAPTSRIAPDIVLPLDGAGMEGPSASPAEGATADPSTWEAGISILRSFSIGVVDTVGAQTPDLAVSPVQSASVSATGSMDGQDTVVAEPSSGPFSPQAADTLAECSPFDETALQTALARLANACAGLDELAGMLAGMGVAPWLVAVAVGLLALEYRRRRAHQSQVGLVLALGAEDATLPWSLGLGN